MSGLIEVILVGMVIGLAVWVAGLKGSALKGEEDSKKLASITQALEEIQKGEKDINDLDVDSLWRVLQDKGKTS